jgi:hypothetical protein
MEDRIHLTIADGIADVRLNHAAKMNALDPAIKLRENSTFLSELPRKSDGLRKGLACWFGDHAFVIQPEISVAP